jgi:hypothetical protein
LKSGFFLHADPFNAASLFEQAGMDTETGCGTET